MDENKEELKTQNLPTSGSCQITDKSLENIKIEEELDEQVNPSQAESPWNIIIVNNIPDDIDRDKFLSIFLEYGTIQDAYIATTRRNFARIIYSTEEEAKKLWEASRINPLKYNDYVLIITLVSDDYCPIEVLPDVCLLEIFTYLTSVKDKLTLESVSKRWRDISKKSWVTFTKLRYYDDAKTIVPRAKKYLRELDLWLGNESEELLRLIATNCTRIKKMSCGFNCYRFEGYSPSLYTLFRQNDNLQYISWYFERISMEKPIELEDVPSELRYLKCTSFNTSPTLVLPKDFTKFRNLQVLILHDVYIEGVDLKKTFENMISLRKLKLTESFTGPEISGIAELTNLEHLSLNGGDLTDDILGKVLKNNKKLKYLNISENPKLTDASFKYVQQLSELKVLIIEGLRQVTDKYLAYMPSAKCVIVNECSLITDQGVEKFLETACNIEWLEVSDAGVTLQCVKAALEWTKCTGKSLELVVNDNINDEYSKLEIEKNNQLTVSTCYEGMDLRENEFYEAYCEETYTMLETRN